MEHWALQAPSSEPEDLPREQGWPCHSPGMGAGVEAALSTRTPHHPAPWPPALSSTQTELASYQGGATASDATYPLEWSLSSTLCERA